MKRVRVGVAVAMFLAPLANGAHAADLFTSEPAALLRTETFSAEANVGYLAGRAEEYVFDRSWPGGKLSQLNWNLDGALAVGGRVAFRPLDWLSVRARGWVAVTGEGSMRDYDFLYSNIGYAGPNSFSHISSSPRTELTKAWQGDVSLAAAYYQDESLALTVIGGFRHFEAKWAAKGGSYSYAIGTKYYETGLLPNQLGIGYQQWWDAPYLGLGASYSENDWTFTLEGIGSPYVLARDKDHHALRSIVFKDDLEPGTMAGVNAGLEYRFADAWSLAGRVEYQKYFLTKGDTRVYDGVANTYTFEPKPSSGAASETVLLSVGIKARL